MIRVVELDCRRREGLSARPFWAMAITAMPGTMRNRSVMRIRSWSTQPPK